MHFQLFLHVFSAGSACRSLERHAFAAEDARHSLERLAETIENAGRHAFSIECRSITDR